MADDQKKPGGFKSFLTHAVPFISAALQVSGPIGAMAGNALAKAIGVEQVPTCLADAEKSYTDALTKAGATSDILEKAKEAERTFQLQCQQMDIDSVDKILALENADRADARARQVAVGDHTPQIGFYILTLLVMVVVCGLLKVQIPNDNKAVIFTLTGSIGTAWLASVTYFYGTSRGSDRKTEILAGK